MLCMLPLVNNWWWYDEVKAWSIFNYLQNCLNQSDIKFVPVSEIIFFGSPNSVGTILAALIRSSANKPPAFFMIGNLMYHSTTHNKILLFMAHMVGHMLLSSHIPVFADTLGTLCHGVFDIYIHIHLVY